MLQELDGRPHRIRAFCSIEVLYEGIRPRQLAACGIPAYKEDRV